MSRSSFGLLARRSLLICLDTPPLFILPEGRSMLDDESSDETWPRVRSNSLRLSDEISTHISLSLTP